MTNNEQEILEETKEMAGTAPEAVQVETPEKKNVFKKHWKVFTVCLLVLIVAIVGVFMYIGKVSEYKTALNFFAEHNLSTDGLSKDDIRAIYRDIQTESFTHPQTADILKNSTLAGQAEIPKTTQPGDAEGDTVQNAIAVQGVVYDYRTEYKKDEELGFQVHDKSYFEQYRGEKLLWSVAFDEFKIEGYTPVEGGNIVFGVTPTWANDQTVYAWLAKVDGKGNVVWKQKIDNGFANEYITHVVENDDGTYAVFSHGDYRYLCLGQYNTAGKRTNFGKTDITGYGIWKVATFDDGYIVQMGGYEAQEKIVKVDVDGNISESFAYADEDSYYYITGMAEHDGKVYLSAYTVPKDEREQQGKGARYEIASVLDYLAENNLLDITSDDLVPLLEEQYAAVVLEYQTNKKTPKELYKVDGALSRGITMNDEGNIVWSVETITTASYTPYASDFVISGTSTLYRYTLRKSGKLISKEETGLMGDYCR